VKTQWEQSKFDDFYRDLNSLLNKMSEQNFDLLKEKLLTMKQQIEDVLEALEVLVKLIFEKALAAPNFAPLYGNLCVVLSEQMTKKFERELPDGQTVAVTFPRLLLDHCRTNFEVCFQPTPPEDLIQEGDDPYVVNEKKEKEFKRKLRMECNITFIAELYIRQLLRPVILFRVIEQLFGRDKENNQLQKPEPALAELCCKLITTLGPRLEAPEIVQRTNIYFR
jgi:hypothetical protein